MGSILLVAFLLMFVSVIQKTDGACCNSDQGFCGDCTRGTPRCGYYSCNIFGCKCGGGCRRPDRGEHCYVSFGRCRCFEYGRRRRSTLDHSETDVAVVFNNYDLNKNGKIEQVEFNVAFNQSGLTVEDLFVQWTEMDENKDGFIAMEELDDDKL